MCFAKYVNSFCHHSCALPVHSIPTSHPWTYVFVIGFMRKSFQRVFRTIEHEEPSDRAVAVLNWSQTQTSSYKVVVSWRSGLSWLVQEISTATWEPLDLICLLAMSCFAVLLFYRSLERQWTANLGPYWRSTNSGRRFCSENLSDMSQNSDNGFLFDLATCWNYVFEVLTSSQLNKSLQTTKYLGPSTKQAETSMTGLWFWR